MRVAILETVKTSGGFEQEFDRLIIRELQKQGHELFYTCLKIAVCLLTLAFRSNICMVVKL